MVMRFALSTALAVLSTALLFIAVAHAADSRWRPQRADAYAAKQKQGDVTVAIKSYHADPQAQDALGKKNPYDYGFLPVLVVITNEGDHAINIENLQVRYVAGRNEGLESIPGRDLQTWNPKGNQPRPKPRYIPNVPGLSRPKVKKGPLAQDEIVNNEFQAPIVPPGASEAGFFYFDAAEKGDPLQGASIYITGLRDMTTGQELFYFEIPFRP